MSWAQQRQAIKLAAEAGVRARTSAAGSETLPLTHHHLRYAMLSRPNGELTRAGQYYYQLIGRPPPSRQHDRNQPLIREGPNDYIMVWGGRQKAAPQPPAQRELPIDQAREALLQGQGRCEGALATAGAVGAATGGLAVAGAGAALVGTAWAIEGGLNAASHLMGWGAATGGGTDSDASRPSMTTDVQTLNGTQESGAVDHYFIQEQRRAQRPEVFRIDTESESEPRNRPLPQIRSRPARRPRAQAQTPFGLNNVPIPVSSGSERSRVSRQSRGDRGPLGTQPSFEALRQASEPEAA